MLRLIKRIQHLATLPTCVELFSDWWKPNFIRGCWRIHLGIRLRDLFLVLVQLVSWFIQLLSLLPVESNSAGDRSVKNFLKHFIQEVIHPFWCWRSLIVLVAIGASFPLRLYNWKFELVLPIILIWVTILSITRTSNSKVEYAYQIRSFI